ncbi:MAG: hypothetical protein M1816_008128 [Peltula sp. TS41687]|nr:MAG: hypothetical protein M1816_008128 [Peltula sp. TS41687]
MSGYQRTAPSVGAVGEGRLIGSGHDGWYHETEDDIDAGVLGSAILVGEEDEASQQSSGFLSSDWYSVQFSTSPLPPPLPRRGVPAAQQSDGSVLVNGTSSPPRLMWQVPQQRNGPRWVNGTSRTPRIEWQVPPQRNGPRRLNGTSRTPRREWQVPQQRNVVVVVPPGFPISPPQLPGNYGSIHPGLHIRSGIPTSATQQQLLEQQKLLEKEARERLRRGGQPQQQVFQYPQQPQVFQYPQQQQRPSHPRRPRRNNNNNNRPSSGPDAGHGPR